MNSKLLLRIFKGPEAIDRVLAPVHNMSFLLTLLATFSAQAVIFEILGPLKDMLACFLVTFPFTLGLTVIFVIILNLNWEKVTGAIVIVAIGLITLFFLLLIFISSQLNLETIGKELRKKQTIEKITQLKKELEEEGESQHDDPAEKSDSAKPPDNVGNKTVTHLNPDSVFSINIVNDNGTINDQSDSTNDKLKETLALSKSHPEIETRLRRFGEEVSKLKMEADPPDPWYKNIPVIGPFIGTLVYFRIVMGMGGFFSAIALAAFFALYIQKLATWKRRQRM